MRQNQRSAERGNEDLLLKIGIYEGPCLAVRLNNSQVFRPDRFGPRLLTDAQVGDQHKKR
jgi:hypothetical protein